MELCRLSNKPDKRARGADMSRHSNSDYPAEGLRVSAIRWLVLVGHASDGHGTGTKGCASIEGASG